jgi:DNA-binding IclR family transcriptional regulator
MCETGRQEPMTETRPKLFSTSLERGLLVLAAFDQGEQTLGLTQLVERTGIEKTAAQRFLSTLVAMGYLLKDPVTRRYSLTARMLHLGSSFLRGNPLIERATPYMLNCNKELGETVNLGVLDDDEVILVARIPSREVVSPNVGLGSSFPWHVSGLGQSIVAYLPDERRQALVSQVNFVRRASNTIMDAEALHARLDQIRSSGSVLVVNENFDGDITVAAPVFDATGEVTAAVNIVVTPQRWSTDKAESLRPTVVVLASALSSHYPSRAK